MQELIYCPKCGTKLEEKWHETEEKMIPYCPSCEEYKFPMFNTAVSMIVMNEKKDKIVLIKQYGRDSYVLVAGYVNQGEDAEDAVMREVREELGLQVETLAFNRSHYFAPSNTLMLNYTVMVKGDIHPNWEVDSYSIFTLEEARKNIRPHSLAEAFLNGYLDGKYDFNNGDYSR